MLQGEEDTNATFLNEYKAATNAIRHYKSSIYIDPGLVKYELEQAELRSETLTDEAAAILVKNKI